MKIEAVSRGRAEKCNPVIASITKPSGAHVYSLDRRLKRLAMTNASAPLTACVQVISRLREVQKANSLPWPSMLSTLISPPSVATR